MVDAFYSAMCREDGVLPGTAKDRVATLRLMQEFAIKRRFMLKRPVTAALAELRGTATPTIRTFTVDEVARLVACARVRRPGGHHDTAAMLECFVNIAAFCGLRYGEIAGGSRAARSISSGACCTSARACAATPASRVRRRGRALRDVPMPPHVAGLLRAYLAKHHRPNPDDLVFTVATGAALKTTMFHETMWGPLLALAGLASGERYHFHALRHFAASFMIENGLALPDMAALLGHAKFDMTLQVYAHPVVGVRRRHDAIDAMAAGFLAAPATIEGQLAA